MTSCDIHITSAVNNNAISSIVSGSCGSCGPLCSTSTIILHHKQTITSFIRNGYSVVEIQTRCMISCDIHIATAINSNRFSIIVSGFCWSFCPYWFTLKSQLQMSTCLKMNPNNTSMTPLRISIRRNINGYLHPDKI